jgi:hypothetical protein
MAGESRQCVLFLTDSVVPRIVRHFERLAEESPFQAFLCLSDQTYAHSASVRLDHRSAGSRFRFRQPSRRLDKLRPFIPGTVDLLWLEAIAAISRKHAFDYYWVLEYDVDFSGHWSHFFDAFADNRADLIASKFFPWRSGDAWQWWRSFNPPPEVTAEHYIKGLLPVTRVSSRLAARLSEFYDERPCSGHAEAMLPTLCSYFGMVLEDISGKPPFGKGLTWIDRPRTFKVDCAGMPNSYFEEDPAPFDRPDMVWHPVKVEGSPNYERKVLGIKGAAL